MILVVLSLVAFVLAAIPALLFRANLRAYRPPPAMVVGGSRRRVSVLIPARNEEQSIQAAVEAALASKGVELEVLVLDDQSTDATAVIVSQLADRDARVRLIEGRELPDGWCGKQYACWVLANNASDDLLLFLDADVRLAPEAAARMVEFLRQSGADLVSGIPLQEMGTLLERLVIPLIHFVLLGFLPLRRMRASRHPGYGTGCGQLILVRRSSYKKAGTHAAIRGTLHDGIKLPRAFRAAGLMTDLCDATDIAKCRMYRSSAEVWGGLAKNATEGIGSPHLIVPITMVLVFGQVLPVVLLGLSIGRADSAAMLAVAALVCSYYPRLAAASRFRQPVLSALLHPAGIAILLAIQWHAFLRLMWRRPSRWKGRNYRLPGHKIAENDDGVATSMPSPEILNVAERADMAALSLEN